MVKMKCINKHTWVETYPKNHPFYGQCPKCTEKGSPVKE